MGKNEQTSPRVGKVASKQLRNAGTSKAGKTTAASALTQRPDAKSGGKGGGKKGR
jgi:hypothetical protein